MSGTVYRAANASEVRELGRAAPLVQLEGGAVKTMNCRVGTVRKCLTAAADICRRGNRVILDDDGSFILNKKTGEVTPLHQVNGTYVMRVKILRPRAPSASAQPIAAVGLAAPGGGEAAMDTSGAGFQRRAQP